MRYGWVVGVGLAVTASPVFAEVSPGSDFCREMALRLAEVAHGYQDILRHEGAFTASMRLIAGNDPENETLEAMALTASDKQDELVEVMRPSSESLASAIALLGTVCPQD